MKPHVFRPSSQQAHPCDQFTRNAQDPLLRLHYTSIAQLSQCLLLIAARVGLVERSECPECADMVGHIGRMYDINPEPATSSPSVVTLSDLCGGVPCRTENERCEVCHIFVGFPQGSCHRERCACGVGCRSWTREFKTGSTRLEEPISILGAWLFLDEDWLSIRAGEPAT